MGAYTLTFYNSYYEKFPATGEVKCIDDDIPFDIPESWEWCRLQSVFILNPKNDAENNLDAAFIPMEKIEATYLSQFSYDVRKWSEIKSGYTHFANGDIAFAKITPCFQNRKSAIFNDLPNGIGAGTTELRVLRPYCNAIDEWYILFFLESGYFVDGASFKGTANQQRIVSGYLENKLLPIPPHNEQLRIVAQLKTLLSSCNQYEILANRINQLNGELSTDLRKSILQYSIQGKLVPQIESEGTAQDLLEQIREEKQLLVKEGKLKKSALQDSTIFKGEDNKYYEKVGNNVECIDEDIPFDIPDTWKWVRFKNICNYSLGKAPERANSQYWKPQDIPWVSIADMTDMSVLTKTKEYISTKALSTKFANTLSPKGTLLMSFKLTIGKISILGIDAVHNEAIISIFPYYNTENIMRDYLFNFLSIITGYTSSTDAIKGATLNSAKIAEMFVPLPPLAEQQRIIQALNNVLTSITRR